MESSNQTKGGLAAATAYNLLRIDVIANVSGVAAAASLAYDASLAASLAWDATVAASAGAADLDTHEAATHTIHGLAAGIDVLGAQTAGLHIQYATGASTWSHTGGSDETHSAYAAWPVAFNNLYAVTVSFGVGSHTADGAYISQPRDMAYTTTGATQVLRVYNGQSENTSCWANFIGIGN